VMFNEVAREDWGRAGKLFIDEYRYDTPDPGPGN
jgi:phenylpyruvate tautomerase PptA (4-oxalocrotonate tautomerase family)